jgi:hypothetical protein
MNGSEAAFSPIGRGAISSERATYSQNKALTGWPIPEVTEN